jgi:hypothetical protein
MNSIGPITASSRPFEHKVQWEGRTYTLRAKVPLGARRDDLRDWLTRFFDQEMRGSSSGGPADRGMALELAQKERSFRLIFARQEDSYTIRTTQDLYTNHRNSLVKGLWPILDNRPSAPPMNRALSPLIQKSSGASGSSLISPRFSAGPLLKRESSLQASTNRDDETQSLASTASTVPYAKAGFVPLAPARPISPVHGNETFSVEIEIDSEEKKAPPSSITPLKRAKDDAEASPVLSHRSRHRRSHSEASTKVYGDDFNPVQASKKPLQFAWEIPHDKEGMPQKEWEQLQRSLTLLTGIKGEPASDSETFDPAFLRHLRIEL